MAILDDDAVHAALTELPQWDFTGDAVVATFVMDTFREAIDFIVRIADLAEAANHHPELENVYNRVRVRLTSHDAGGVTERDVELARRIDGAIHG